MEPLPRRCNLGRSSVTLAVAELAELMVERADDLLRRTDHRPVDRVAFVDRCDGRDSVHPRLHRAAKVGIAAARAVDVRDVDLDVGDPPLEAGEALADLVFEAAVAFIVAVDLVVGVNLDKQFALSIAGLWRMRGRRGCSHEIWFGANASPRLTLAPMAKPKRRYVCQSCGSVQSRWQGQCPDCSGWNTLVEDSGGVVTPFSARHNLRSGGTAFELVGLDSEVALPERMSTGIREFDRAMGGGIVAGSATLIGGDPGIGKSTLLLQAAARIAERGLDVAYISGEEATDQVRLRARRLGLGSAPVRLAAATSVRDILTTLGEGPPPALVVI